MNKKNLLLITFVLILATIGFSINNKYVDTRIGARTGPTQFKDLSDVVINSVSGGQSVIWNATTSKWVNGSVSVGGYLSTTTAASTYVPYTGASDNLDLGLNSLTASNLSGTNTGDETDETIGTLINSSTSTTTPAEDDKFAIFGSVSSALQNITWTNLKSSLKSYFDTVYSTAVKAIGSELDTGTDDSKFATAKAIKDSHNVPSVVPGASGNILTSNGTDWISAAPEGGSSDPYFIASNIEWGSAGSNGRWTTYTDDLSYIPMVYSYGSPNYIYLTSGLLAKQDGNYDRYLSNVQQKVSIATIWANAVGTRGAAVIGSYIYVHLIDDSPATVKIFRCPLSSSIATAGNWTELTISGTIDTGYYLVGYGDGKFWFKADSSSLRSGTMSGTTLTMAGSTLSPTSMYDTVHPVATKVNDNGIYYPTATGGAYRHCDFSGTDIPTIQFGASVPSCFVTKTSLYSFISTSGSYYSGFSKIN